MIVLASKSSARQLLLANAGVRFEVAHARIDERKVQANASSEMPDQNELSVVLAAAKAVNISKDYPHAYVIGADQTLHFEGSYFNKPADEEELRQQLTALRGKKHTLCSAAAIAKDGEIVWSGAKSAHLTMRDFSDEELSSIIKIEGSELLSCVGGYRFEGPSINFFDKIDGDYFTILGLPLLDLLNALRELREI